MADTSPGEAAAEPASAAPAGEASPTAPPAAPPPLQPATAASTAPTIDATTNVSVATTVQQEEAPVTAPKRVYSIFAPRNAARGEAVAQKEDEEQREQRSEASVSQEDNNDKEGEAQKKGNGAGSRRPARKRGAKDAGGLKQSVLSLVDDSGDSDDTSTASGTAPKGKKRAPVKGKGKGAAAAARTTKNGKATTRKKDPIATTDEDRDASDDDDDEVFVSEAGSSTSLAGSASTRRRPQRTRSRRESPPGEVGPTSLGQTPSGSFVLDLTSSPTRGAKSKRKSRLKTSTSATEGSEGPFASTSSAVSEPRSTGFAPLAEVYGAAREKRRKGLEGLEPRWPTAEEHVGGWPAPPAGGQPTPVPDLSLGKGKAKEVLAEADDVGPAFFARFERTIRQPSAAGATATACPTTSRPASSLPFLLPSPLPPHPLLGRLAAPLRAGQVPERSNDALWTVKYAPQKAEEVLGSASQQSAKWLKEWLEELKVVGARKAGLKRRRVERGLDVAKKKKRKKRRADGLDDFFASSSEEEDDFGSSPFASSPGPEDEDLDPDGDFRGRDDGSNVSGGGGVFPNLTNLILLQGPHGSGKSSTVHAVARELGYEVFEVFPGLGRRSARDLERYVGDAARNHVVNGSPRKKGAGGGGGALAAMFGRQRAQANGSNGSGTVIGAAPGRAGAGTPGRGSAPEPATPSQEVGPAQSLILIDEVDVFFRHEEDCWAGIAALAKQSRRPIIMTCTALNEGHQIPPASLTDLYDRSSSKPYPAWMLQQQMGTSRRAGGGGFGARPLAPDTSTQPLVSRDLRKALMQLEVECQRGRGSGQAPSAGRVEICEGPVGLAESEQRAREEGSELSGPGGLEQAALAVDALSWADAYVDRRIEVMIEDDETGRNTHPNDVEYSHPILEYLPDPNSTRLPYIGYEHEIATELRTRAARAWRGAPHFGKPEDEELEAKRADFTSWLGMLTQAGEENAIVQPPAAILPSYRPVTEIAPLLRHLTRLDDEGERALVEAARAAVAEGDSGALDSLSVAAALSGAGAGPGAQMGPRRSTRQKLKQGGGQPVYERRLPWASEAEAEWLRDSGFNA
ncbi:hypothetical protein JCM8202v2_000122 [Rhodotorula sphaerocarpa]